MSRMDTPVLGQPNQKRTETDDHGNLIETITHDEHGLSLDPKDWARRDCPDCHGKGFIWKLRMSDKHNEMHPCGCAGKRYQVARKRAQGEHDLPFSITRTA